MGTADGQEWSREKSKKSQTALSAGLAQATEEKELKLSMGLLSLEETSVSPTGVVIAEPWP